MVEISPYTGEAYLERLTDSIAHYFRVDGVYVTELAVEIERCDLVASYPAVAARYPVDFSGWQAHDEIIARGSVLYAADVVRHFPLDNRLEALGPEALVGAAVRASSGDPIGVLLVVHHSPLTQTQAAFIEAVLQELAPRVGSELERRQHDFSLRRNHTRLSLLTDHAKDGYFYVEFSPTAEVTYINPAIETLFEVPVEAFHANPQLLFDMLKWDHKTSEEALLSGCDKPFVTKMDLASGTTRWVEFRGFAVRGPNNRLAGLGGTVQDVTCRVDAEDALRTKDHYLQDLLSAIPDTLLLLRSDGQLLEYVPGEVDMGIHVAEEARGRDIKELMPPATVGAFERIAVAASRSHRVQRVLLHVPGPQPHVSDMQCLPFGDDACLFVLRNLAVQARPRAAETTDGSYEGYPPVEGDIRPTAYGLTDRELAVLSLIVEGMADKQIADALGITTYTVNKHVGNVLGKMNAVTRTGAAVRAIREGFLPRDGGTRSAAPEGGAVEHQNAS
jgi:DNA-binding CsgD family transcriptional regulator/PAS domain-containing protein